MRLHLFITLGKSCQCSLKSLTRCMKIPSAMVVSNDVKGISNDARILTF